MINLFLAAIGLASLLGVLVFSLAQFREASASQRFAIVLFPVSQIMLATFLFIVVGVKALGVSVSLAITVVCVACAMTSAALMRAVRASHARRLDEERTELLADQVKTQEAYAVHLEEEAQRAAVVRAELADALALVRESLEAGSADGTVQRLAQAEEVLHVPSRMFCANRVVDVLMGEKSVACEEAGIVLMCSLDVRADLPFSPVDLCAVFANVMDNAVAAASVCRLGERRIEMRAVEAVGLFVVDVVNSCIDDGENGAGNGGNGDADAEREKRHPAHGLAEHGWGLSILDDIASRYDGIVEHESTANSHRTTVSLVVPARENAA